MPSDKQAFVNRVMKWASDNYDSGGDVIIECFTDDKIFAQFNTLEDVKKFCKLRKEREDEVRVEVF